MGMVVRSNLMAVNAQRQLGMNNNQVGKALEKLSSGYRINRAGDDASGLAISEKMKAQIRGLDTASLNSQDGISVVQTAEGALTEVHNMLNRMTELATRSANGINSAQNRQSLQDEITELKTEIDRISRSTNFNGINILDGSMSDGNIVGLKQPKNTAIKIGADGGKATATLDFKGMKAYGNGKVTVTVAGKEITFEVKETDDEEKIATAFKTAFDAAKFKDGPDKDLTATVNGTKVELKTEGAANFDTDLAAALGKDFSVKATAGNPDLVKGDTVEFDIGSLDLAATKKVKIAGVEIEFQAAAGTDATKVKVGTKVEETIANIADHLNKTTAFKSTYIAEAQGGKLILTAKGHVASADIAKIETTKNAASVKNADRVNAVVNATGKGLALQIGDTSDGFNRLNVKIGDMSSSGVGVAKVDISTRAGAAEAIDTIRAAIDKVSAQRAVLGATQNRLEYTINNLDTASENIQAANSRIRDTDMAKMMMEYTKTNVLTQSAQAMLAQANQQPQSVLQLLQ